MKKIIKLSALLCAIALTVAFIPFTQTASAQQSTPVFTAAQMEKSISEFIGVGVDNRQNRTTFTDYEKNAVNWLNAKIGDIGGENVFEIDKKDFTYEDNTSSNLEVRYRSGDSGKQVIIGANYDNVYGSVDMAAGTAASGALMNATGVSVVLSIAEYLAQNKPDYGFDVVLVFFGAAEKWHMGSSNYVANQMTADQRMNTLLMINLQRLGGDYTYLYTDEVDTLHGNLMLESSAAVGAGIVNQPKSAVYLNADYISDTPYTTWGMIGDHAPFMTSGINVANIFGGNLQSLNLGNAETQGGNISYTPKDNLETLKAVYPQFSAQMANAANTVIESLSRPDFREACLNSKAQKYNYYWLTKPIIVSAIVIGVILLLAAALLLIVKRFEKKYPFKPIVRRLKIAVFGMDYETSTDEDIYVDIKQTDKNNNPFDGF